MTKLEKLVRENGYNIWFAKSMQSIKDWIKQKVSIIFPVKKKAIKQLYFDISYEVYCIIQSFSKSFRDKFIETYLSKLEH